MNLFLAALTIFVNSALFGHQAFAKSRTSERAAILASAKLNRVSTVSRDQLAKIKALATDLRIVWEHEFNHCEKRAYLLSQHLEKKMKIRTGVLLVTGDLTVPSRHLPIEADIHWQWHIVSYVLVKDSGKLVPYVLDFTLFDDAVPLETWLSALEVRSEIRSVQAFSRFVDSPYGESDPKATEWRGDQEGDYENLRDDDGEPNFDRSRPARPDAAKILLAGFKDEVFDPDFLNDSGESTRGISELRLADREASALEQATRCDRISENAEYCRTYVDLSGSVCWLQYELKTESKIAGRPTATCHMEE
jgi:hypothetical protein